MGQQETNVLNLFRIASSPLGFRWWRNNRGLFLTLDGRAKVRAGIEADGASDLIGYKSFIITPEMVGMRFARLCVAEIKTKTGGKGSSAQKQFVQNIKDAGGIAIIYIEGEDVAARLSE